MSAMDKDNDRSLQQQQLMEWLRQQSAQINAGKELQKKSQTAATKRPAQAAGSRQGKAAGISPGDFTAKDLTQESLDAIITKYGTDIEEIFNLAPGQEWMFGRARKVTNAFFLQTYMKITMPLKPAEFRQKVDEVSLKRINLRTAFAYRGMDKPYQVVLRNRRPELEFIDRSRHTLDELEEEINKFRASDRRRGFDLEKDPLLRITIFSTAEKDTYAVIMSQPHINDDGQSEALIMKDIFIDYVLDGKFPMPQMPQLAPGVYQNYAEWLEKIDKDSELRYWEELLSGSKMTRLPGRLESSLDPVMNTQIMKIDPGEGRRIQELSSRYRATMNSIAQTAWGVMLQKLYRRDDAMFGSITSGRTAEVSGNDMMTGGFVNAFPVRVKCGEDMSFAELTGEVQKQILISQTKAHCSPDEIGERLGFDGPVFDHLLNFHNFGGGKPDRMPALPGFSVLGYEFFDNLSTGFCLYFRTDGSSLLCQFTYDGRSFSDRKIRMLMKCYRTVLEQIIADESATLKVGDIQCPDITCFLDAEDVEAEERQGIASFLRSLPLFDGVDDDCVLRFADAAELNTFTEGDVIIRERTYTDGISIVMDGFVEEYRSSASGWINTLSSLRSGRLLTASGILNDVKTYSGFSAISDEVRIIRIPKENMLKLTDEYPAVLYNILREAYNTAGRYSMLWVNSDY